MQRPSIIYSILWLAIVTVGAVPVRAQEPQRPSVTLFESVRVFDGISDQLTEPVNVLIRGNIIEKISADPIPVDRRADTRIIDGTGRTLIPGLIDAHTHVIFSSLPQQQLLLEDFGFVQIAASKAAEDMLQRGFTSVRDMGGPIHGLKRAIDRGLVSGPRIWPAGAFISQTGGHGDFRLPNDFPARPGDFTYTERIGAAAIADSPDTVRQRVREQLTLGASHIKLMAGGGVTSHYDPLDVTQFTVEELRAAVEAAENWGTYVAVHAYTPRAVRQAIEAGVKCIEHGQLLDDATAQLMAEKEIWWSLQPFLDDNPDRFPAGSANRIKELQVADGTDIAYRLARHFKIKTAWGTDVLFSTDSTLIQNQRLVHLLRWFTEAEALKMATSTNAELLALSGLRSPYAGKLGVIQEGALADLILVDGNPLEDFRLLADPYNKFVVIMKDGKIYKGF
ncbi:MAG TPA: amidohydrolase family protein [Pirellulaceae bacterium]|nr:amidohydrolase family protein [Pirellulaceae bacterium]HMO92927.1 amidohydrolase family protein [Pirellulaceae bacterium]HMP71052.1 amidohydrolase family protein [Pirellulaceae bacterium]